MADRYHVYLWILDIVIFRPDKFCSQVVVRGNVSGHRWSTYLLKQSMIESGYIIDGAGAAGTPPGVGSPSTGCTQGGVVPDAQQPHWASPPWACRQRAAQGPDLYV